MSRCRLGVAFLLRAVPESTGCNPEKFWTVDAKNVKISVIFVALSRSLIFNYRLR